MGNATILCTIHQPSSEVFHIFDKAIFLMQGRILYQGPVKSIVSVLDTAGFKCPDDYNPADFLMYLTQTETLESLSKEGLLVAAPRDDDSTLPSPSKAEQSAEAEGCETVVKASFLTQICWITHREALSVSRNIPALIGRFGVTIFLSIIFGVIFKDAGSENNADRESFNTHVGLVTFTMINGTCVTSCRISN
jgi:hypothetical protein